MNQTALLIIDVQQGAFNGELVSPIDRPDSLIENTVSLLEAARATGTPVFFVQHCEGPGELFTKGTPHWELHDALAPRPSEIVIQKSESSAFAGTNLRSELEAANARSLILCGLQSEFCVSNTAKAALSGGFSVTVAQDAHRTWPSQEQAAAEISEVVNQALQALGATLFSTAALVRSLREAET
jgi:nicotinamidase-related amidase